MTSAYESTHRHRQIAAITAAVQAYLDSEKGQPGGKTVGLNAWRRATLSETNEFLTDRVRSWTGRN